MKINLGYNNHMFLFGKASIFFIIIIMLNTKYVLYKLYLNLKPNKNMF